MSPPSSALAALCKRPFSPQQRSVDLLTYLAVLHRFDPEDILSPDVEKTVRRVLATEKIRTNHLDSNKMLDGARVEERSNGSTRVTARLRVCGRTSEVEGAIISLKINVRFLFLVFFSFRVSFEAFTKKRLILQDFYKAQHGLTLRYPHLPLVQCEGARFPMELLTVILN